MKFTIDAIPLSRGPGDLAPAAEVIHDTEGLRLNVYIAGQWRGRAELVGTADRVFVQVWGEDLAAGTPAEEIQVYPAAPSELTRFTDWLKAEIADKQKKLAALNELYMANPLPATRDAHNLLFAELNEDRRILAQLKGGQEQ